MPFNSQTSLKILLPICTSPGHEHYQEAWREFAHRYHHLICLFVKRSCRKWYHTRIQRQFNDVVEDVVGRVYIVLLERLETFRIADADKFPAWLSRVCHNEVLNAFKRKTISQISEGDPADFQNKLKEMPQDAGLELYEYLVSSLRNISGNQKQQPERDIHLFCLYLWADLSQPAIARHPCLPELGERVIEVSTSRLRNGLKQALDDGQIRF